MKIAMIGQKGMPAVFGGVERHVEALSRELANLGHEVTVYARSHYTNTSHYESGVYVRVLPSVPTRSLDTITHTFFSTLHALYDGADVIHYHGVGPSLLSFIPRILNPRCTVITTFHCIDRLHQKWGIVARFFLRVGEWTACAFPHATIVVSKELQSYCKAQYARRTICIPHGVAQATPVRNEARALRALGIRKGYILTVARLIPHKGIHYVVSAYNEMSGVRARLPQLVIVGDGVGTDAYVHALRELAGDNKNIVFTGFVTGDPLKALYSGARLIVQPSESEGMSMVTLEAMSWGKPLLVSDIKANMQVIKGYGLSFKNKSVRDLAHKLNMMLTHPSEYASLGAQAQSFARATYSWPAVCKATVRAYSQARSLPLRAQRYATAKKRQKWFLGSLGTSRI